MNDFAHHSQTQQGKLKNNFSLIESEESKRQKDLMKAKTSIWKKLLKT